MFEHVIKDGSVISIALMVYTSAIYFDVLLASKESPFGVPGIYRHPVSSLLLFVGIPCAIWPAIYVVMFDGVVAGIVFWIAQQLISQVIISPIAGIRQGRPSGVVHFILATIAYPVGYYLSLTNLP